MLFRSFDERPGEGYGVRKRWPGAGDTLRTGDFDPAMAVLARQIQKRPKWRLIEPCLGRHAPHVVDNKGHGQLVQKVVELDQIGRVKMQVDMPPERLNALQDAMKLVHVRHAAQVLHEVEAHSPKALLVKLREIMLGKGVVRVRDTTILATALGNGVDNDRVIHTMATRVHEHGTFQAQDRLQLLETRQRRVRRRIGSIGCVRISVTRAKYMAVRITGARHWTVLRLVGVRVRGFAGGNAHRADFTRLNGGLPTATGGDIWYRNGQLRRAQ